MEFEFLKKAYDAVEMLKALNLPVSDEQLKGIAVLERQYLQENVIPTMRREIEPFLAPLRSSFKVNVTFSTEEGLNFSFDSENLNDSSQNNPYFRDRTKYSIDGGEPLNKRRFVWNVVKEYVKNNPSVTLDGLEKRFPTELSHSAMHGVIRRYDDIMRRLETQPDLRKRFYLNPEDIITLQDGTRVCVYNQWGTTFDRFLAVAKQLHSVESFE